MAYQTTELGARLRSLREGKDRSRQFLADFVGACKSTIEKIEYGLRQPSIDMLVRLADVLGVDPMELVKPAIADARERMKGATS